jgi:cell wall-associated NlpC family hydrolase
MLFRLRILLVLFSLLLTGVAQATPSEAAEDLSQMLANSPLINQIEQVGQTVSHTTTDLVSNALGFLGVPYKRGGNSADTGFDCSGFVKTTYEKTIGLILPRKASQQAAATEQIDKSELQPGDLVFFNTMRRAFSHVGIYIGEGKFIHAPKPGAEVRVDNLGQSYWRRHFDGARRVIGAISPIALPEAISSPETTPQVR